MLSFLVVMIFFFVMYLISDSGGVVKEKVSPFECGVENYTKTRVPFSMQFFFIGVIFILFDMEIVFLIHFMMSGWWAVGGGVLFVVGFMVGLLTTLQVEWLWGSLVWVF